MISISVTGNGVRVLNFNCNGYEGTSYAITDSANNTVISFDSVKTFQNVVFAGDSLSADGEYYFMSGGTQQGGEAVEGISFGGVYSAGTVAVTLS